MVGPSLTESDRAAGMNRLRAAVVALVASSGALVALYADASLPVVAAGALAGAGIGLALWYNMVWTYRDGSSRDDRDQDSSYDKRERFD
jgi:hypothetical protein